MPPEAYGEIREQGGAEGDGGRAVAHGVRRGHVAAVGEIQAAAAAGSAAAGSAADGAADGAGARAVGRPPGGAAT